MLNDTIRASRNGARDPVVVCGAGAAGLAAALAAARDGADVVLVEASTDLGGTVAGALLHTLAGLYDSAGEMLNGGLPLELMERLRDADARVRQRRMGRAWVLQVCPHTYRRTVTDWIGEEERIDVLCGAAAIHVGCGGGRVSEVQIQSKGSTFCVRPRAVIDATGTAAVARMIDATQVVDDEQRAAGGMVVRLRNVAAGALEFPKGLGIVRALRDAAEAGALPRACRQAWIDAGIEPDEAYLKLFVPLGGGSDVGRNELAAMQDGALGLLRTFADFARAEVAETGRVGIRDGGRIRGRYVLTADDVRGGRSFEDGVCRCAWPIEYWDPERGVKLEYLPDGIAYQIPERSLQLAGINNFWAAGKCLSADRLAHASARVVGTCWAMGQAAGEAAARFRVSDAEQHGEHEPLRAVSGDRTATTGAPGGARSAAGKQAVISGAG